VPNDAVTGPAEKPRPRSEPPGGERPGMALSDEPESTLTRLVNEANAVIAAAEQGLRCECPQPDASCYGWEGHGPFCRTCNRPRQNV
jgi:hypothetical protein